MIRYFQTWLHGLSMSRDANSTTLDQARMVVVDVETTGLRVHRDRLLSIGAVAVQNRQIDLSQQFECTLRADTDLVPENILIHGIPPSEVAQGLEPHTALRGFLDFVGDSVLVAFHAEFDRQILKRAIRQHSGESFDNIFLDAALLAPSLLPSRAPRQNTLDNWLDACGLTVSTRHHASADAMATAELLLILLHHARRAGIRDIRGLRRRMALTRDRQAAQGLK